LSISKFCSGSMLFSYIKEHPSHKLPDGTEG
jgi:hypothetical protein